MKKIVFDIETTSAEKDTCRIVELAIKQIDEHGSILINKSKRYNPGVPISPSATETHGITDDMVKNCPKFADDAKKLKKIFEDATLIGYNIMVFDIPVLVNEFERAGIELNLSRSVIDVMKLETFLSPRTLGAVYERYTGTKLEKAHEAQADVDATFVVLQHQLKKIEKDGISETDWMEKCGVPADAADFFGRLKYDDEGFLIYNFGKKALGKRVVDEVQYSNWVLGESFPSQVKKLIREELKKNTKNQFTKNNTKKHRT